MTPCLPQEALQLNQLSVHPSRAQLDVFRAPPSLLVLVKTVSYMEHHHHS